MTINLGKTVALCSLWWLLLALFCGVFVFGVVAGFSASVWGVLISLGLFWTFVTVYRVLYLMEQIRDEVIDSD